MREFQIGNESRLTKGFASENFKFVMEDAHTCGVAMDIAPAICNCWFAWAGLGHRSEPVQLDVRLCNRSDAD